jgi:hypothetical protein
MKKYLIALLFGMSLMAMQTASAASLALSQTFGTGSVTTPSGTTVSGNGSGSTLWDVTLTGLGAGGTADITLLNQVVTGPVSFFASGFLGTNGIGVGDGTYQLLILLAPTSSSFTFDVALSNVAQGVVPVPAAVWLFGSALMGLVGVARRKSQPALTA